MKWHKFVEIRRKHPEIVTRMEYFGNYGSLSSDEQLLKKYVRETVDYIAFRPKENLGLDSSPTETKTMIEKSRWTRKLDNVSFDFTLFKVQFHVGDEPTQSWFVDRWLPGSTIGLAMDKIVAAFQATERYRGKVLIWEDVVKIHGVQGTLVGTYAVSFEIYSFPAEYPRVKHHLTAPTDPTPEHELAAHKAYVDHKPMPPLVPSAMAS